jgi:integrase/recombinase XerD
VIDVRANDLQLTRPYQLRLFGKGRKERYCPLWPQTAQVLRAFCGERRIDLHSDARVFLNHRGSHLTRFGVRYILAKHVDRARPAIATLGRKRLHPHSMRHYLPFRTMSCRGVLAPYFGANELVCSDIV